MGAHCIESTCALFMHVHTSLHREHVRTFHGTCHIIHIVFSTLAPYGPGPSKGECEPLRGAPLDEAYVI